MKTKLLCTFLTLLICASCENPWMIKILSPFFPEHQWGGWTVTANATETADGVETRTCSVCGETETRFSGEYATGTTGLDLQLINSGTAYSVSAGTVTSGAVHIPAYHRPDANSPYLPVTSIENMAFQYLISITSITIPNSVMSIGGYAFHQCVDLTSIIIPNSVMSIDISAFEYCISLASLTIGEGVTSIGEGAFYECTSLTSITIPASVTSINDNAFEICDSLTSVTFEGTIASDSFGSNAFDGNLVTAYLGGGAGTYTRDIGGTTWTKM